MRRVHKYTLGEGGRAAAQVYGQAVPCVFSRTGSHMVTVAVSKAGHVVGWHVPCAGRREVDAAERLGGGCCGSVVQVIQAALAGGLIGEATISRLGPVGSTLGLAAGHAVERRTERAHQHLAMVGQYSGFYTSFGKRMALLTKWARRKSGAPVTVDEVEGEHLLALLGTSGAHSIAHRPWGLYLERQGSPATDSYALVAATRWPEWEWGYNAGKVLALAKHVFHVMDLEGSGVRCLSCGVRVARNQVEAHKASEEHAVALEGRVRAAVNFLQSLRSPHDGSRADCAGGGAYVSPQAGVDRLG